MCELRRWKVEFSDEGSLASKQLAPPPGYDASSTGRLQSTRSAAAAGEVTVTVSRQAQESAAVSQALGAFKSVGMMAFMMWMSGSQLHIFSIMSVMSGLVQPLSAIFSSGKAFKSQDPEVDTRQAQLLFCLINGLGVMFALYRLNGMGLLPTHASDFAAFFTAPLQLEHSSGAVI